MTTGCPRWIRGAWILAALACSSPAKKSAAVPVAAAVPGAVAAASAKPAENPIPPAVAGGAVLYKTKGCVMCHGDDAKGGVRNRYSQSEFIPALDKVADGYTSDELKQKIRKGVSDIAKADPNGLVPILRMPAWEDKLTPEELDQVCAYLLSLAPKAAAGKDDF